MKSEGNANEKKTDAINPEGGGERLKGRGGKDKGNQWGDSTGNGKNMKDGTDVKKDIDLAPRYWGGGKGGNKRNFNGETQGTFLSPKIRWGVYFGMGKNESMTRHETQDKLRGRRCKKRRRAMIL